MVVRRLVVAVEIEDERKVAVLQITSTFEEI
jgi:hypothetical protein